MDKDFRITTEKQYEETMITIFELQEQEDPLTATQKAEMAIMLIEAQRFEDEDL